MGFSGLIGIIGAQEGNKYFAGELSATLVDTQMLLLMSFLELSGKTNPYVVLMLGDQAIRSKMNSQTTIIGPLGEPIWNQDFHLLVANPRKQRLSIQVKDSFCFTDFTIGTGEQRGRKTIKLLWVLPLVGLVMMRWAYGFEELNVTEISYVEAYGVSIRPLMVAPLFFKELLQKELVSRTLGFSIK